MYDDVINGHLCSWEARVQRGPFAPFCTFLAPFCTFTADRKIEKQQDKKIEK